MRNALSIEVTAEGSGTHARLAGDIDLDTRDDLADALAGLGVSPRHLSLDLRRVTFLDSSGLNMLLELQDQCVANGGALQLIAPPDHVCQLLKIAGLEEHLTITEG